MVCRLRKHRKPFSIGNATSFLIAHIRTERNGTLVLVILARELQRLELPCVETGLEFLVQAIGGEEGEIMKKGTEVEYTDAPPDVEAAFDAMEAAIEQGEDPFVDVLPPPEQLVLKRPKQKVTLMLDKSSVEFFKRSAGENGVKYQTMINNLLENYVKKYS